MPKKRPRYDPDPAGSVMNRPPVSDTGTKFRITDSWIRVQKKYLRIVNTCEGRYW